MTSGYDSTSTLDPIKLYEYSLERNVHALEIFWVLGVLGAG